MKQITQRREKNWRKSFLGDFIVNKNLYLMALPGLLYYLIFCYGPMYGILIAFLDYSPAGKISLDDWVGFKHFIDYFNSPYFFRILKNTLGISIYSLCVSFPAPIILAILMNELKNEHFKKSVQTITYIPHFISVVVMAGMIVTFTMKDGIINDFLALFGIGRSNLLVRPELFKTIYVFSGIWQGVGWGSIVYLSAICGIDEQLYDAAVVDGANRFHKIIHVTIPGILPTVVTLFIINVGSLLGVGFEKIILLYNPTTYETADVISSYVYRKGLEDMQFSFSTAVGLFNSVVGLILVTATNYISKKLQDVSLW